MRKILSILLALLLCVTLFCGCSFNFGTVDPTEAPVGTEPTESIPAATDEEPQNELMADIQEKLKADKALCAVAYVGYNGGSFAEIQKGFETEGLTDALPILAEVKEEHLISCAGSELYLVVPREDVSLAVYEQLMDEDTGEVTYGEELYKQSETAPLLLRGNISDIFPNLAIVIEGQGGETLEYCPSLSLKDGTLFVNSMLICDLTPYELLDIYTGPEVGGEDPRMGSWFAEAPNTAGETMLLELVLDYDGTASYCYGPAQSELLEFFEGQWHEEDGMLVLELFSGPLGDSEAAYDYYGKFQWEYDDWNLTLTHTDGYSLIYGLEGGSMTFTPSSPVSLSKLWSHSEFVFEADEYLYRDLEFLYDGKCNLLVHNGEGTTYAAYEGTWSLTEGVLSFQMQMHSGNNYLEDTVQELGGTYIAVIDADGWLTLHHVSGDAITDYMYECGLETFEPIISFG